MPKVSVYLPDELYREARMRQLPLSSLVQEAVERALRNSDRQEWVVRVRSPPPSRRQFFDVPTAMTSTVDECDHLLSEQATTAGTGGRPRRVHRALRAPGRGGIPW